ncbi:MAG: sulfatase/phosphatase domain-containing protein, partial [Candidatus Arcticimaribacter sp.]
GSLYEGGIHVPLVVSGYGVSRRGEEENALVTAVDLYNTFLDAAGLALEENLDSQSFWPLIREGVSNDRRFNYSEIIGDRPNKSGYTLSDGRYKFLSLNNGNELLFDLQNDLSETTNLLEGQLTTSEETRLAALREEALRIRQ